MSRKCKTVVLGNDLDDLAMPFEELCNGQAFIRFKATDPNNPCVYYKSAMNQCIHHGGASEDNPVRDIEEFDLSLTPQEELERTQVNGEGD